MDTPRPEYVPPPPLFTRDTAVSMQDKEGVDQTRMSYICRAQNLNEV